MKPLETASVHALLEIWAAWYVANGRVYRQLWYPSGTSEHRYARAGGIRSSPVSTTFEGDSASLVAEQVDGVLARLRLHRRPWFNAVTIRTLDASPIELQAQALHTNVRSLQRNYDGGIRWLRREMCYTELL